MKLIVKMILIAILSVGYFAGGDVAHAEPHDKLVPMLGKIDGWKAEKTTGSSLAAGEMKIITAHRSYKKGKKNFRANLMVNSGPPPANQIKEYSKVDGEKSINTKQIDGYWVTSTFLKQRKLGEIAVQLVHNSKSHSILTLDFADMTPEETIAIAKKFQWKELKNVTEKML